MRGAAAGDDLMTLQHMKHKLKRDEKQFTERFAELKYNEKKLVQWEVALCF